jgi:hypothetical protein
MLDYEPSPSAHYHAITVSWLSAEASTTSNFGHHMHVLGTQEDLQLTNESTNKMPNISGSWSTYTVLEF